MGFLDFFKTPDINQGVKECRATPGAVLLDVRTPQEYQGGHIPGSKNLPLQALNQAAAVIPEKITPVFVYCYSGSRSSQAVGKLKKMGYHHIKNIGGISSWSGEMEYE